MSLQENLARLRRFAAEDNIASEADEILEGGIAGIGQKAVREFELDATSRKAWETTAKNAIAAAVQKREPKSWPFEESANVKFPLITVGSLQFAARAYPALVDGNRVVKTQVVGADPNGEKRKKGDRIAEHMSYQLLHKIEDWEDDTDAMLHALPITGMAFRKIFRAPEENRAEMVSALDLVVDNTTRNLVECPRITQIVRLYPHQIEKRKRDGRFSDDFEFTSEGEDDDKKQEFLEQHRLIDLDEDGLGEPYIVTVHKKTQAVARIVVNFDPDEIRTDQEQITSIPKTQFFVPYRFLPDPEGGFYGMGFGKLLESLGETIDTTINQMLDAATIQNAGGGFIGSGVRFKKSLIRLNLAEYQTVESAGVKLRDAIWNFEHPGPSAVLFTLLGLMLDAARDITSVKDVLTGEQERNQTATATLALIEQGLKVFTAIFKRIHRSMGKEFKLLFELNRKFLTQEEYTTVHDQQGVIHAEDYNSASVDVLPVADPKLVTDIQKTARAELLLQFVDRPEFDNGTIFRRFLEAVGQPDINELLPGEQPPSEQDKLQLEDAVASIEDKKAGAMQKAAKAEESQAKAEGMRAEREAAEFGREVDEALAS